MKAAVIPIGNSKGIRIPKALLVQCELRGEVELEVRGRELVIRSARAPRAGWETAFQTMAERRDDVVVDRVAEPATEWAEREWEW